MKKLMLIVILLISQMLLNGVRANTTVNASPMTVENVNEHKLYFPVVGTACKFHFGVSIDDNASKELEDRVYKSLFGDSQCTVDPYEWNVIPNKSSSVQIIRTCKDWARLAMFCWKDRLVQKNGKNFHQYVKNNRGQMYLIGNEPDNRDLSAGDNLSPKEYAQMYVSLATVIRSADPSAKIIFGQATFPIGLDRVNDQFKFSSGNVYMEKAYFEAKRLLPTIESHIDGFAVHSYQHSSFQQWVNDMNHFKHWVNHLDNGKFNGHPLWLTEFGKLNNRCYGDQSRAACANGVDYGKYQQIQEQSAKWFLNQSQWKGAWWFTAGCTQSINVHGDLFEHCNANPKLTKTGQSLKATVQNALK